MDLFFIFFIIMFIIMSLAPFIIFFILVRKNIMALKIDVVKIIKDIVDYCKNNNIDYNEKLSNGSKVYSVLKDTNIEKHGYGKYSYVMSGERDGISFFILTSELIGKSSSTQTGATLFLANNLRFKTICVLSKDNISMPDFVIREKNFLDDTVIAKSLSNLEEVSDVSFIEDASFSKKFYLYGSDGNSIKDFFDKRVRDAFYHKFLKGCSYETKGNCFIAYVDGMLSLNERLKLLANTIDIYCKLSEN